MASLFADMVYKIYPAVSGARSVFVGNNQWGAVDFGFGKDLRLIQMRSVFGLRVQNSSIDYPDGGLAIDYDVKYSLQGTIRDVNRRVIPNINPTIYEDNFNPGTTTFKIAPKLIILSSENPNYEPGCLYFSGFRPLTIDVMWSEAYVLPVTYFGRLWVQFEFEVS